MPPPTNDITPTPRRRRHIRAIKFRFVVLLSILGSHIGCGRGGTSDLSSGGGHRHESRKSPFRACG